MFFLSVSDFLSDRFAQPEATATIDPRLFNEVIYLPALGAGRSSVPAPEQTTEAHPEELPTQAASSVDGVSYPGPQALLSDFPVPTIPIQTLIRPAVEDLLPVEASLILPNVVQMARALKPAEPEPPTPVDGGPAVLADKPEPSQPESLTEVVRGFLDSMTMAELPQETLPVELRTSSPIDTPELMSRLMIPQEPPTPEIPEVDPIPEIDLSAVELAETSLSSRSLDSETLLALSPVPALLDDPVQVPFTELRGRFAIAPEADLAASGTESGTELAADSLDVGPGGTSPAGGDSALEDEVRNDPAGTVASGGMANADGIGLGMGVDDSRWVAIGGETSETGTVRNPAVVILEAAPLRMSYGLTIISTERSGGGLPDMGVFSSEKVHTVYLDMRSSEIDPTPSWILEFAVLQDPEAAATVNRNSGQGQPELLLPFPATKEQPILPPALVRKYLRQMVIVYGVVNVKGKMEQLTIKRSPDWQLNEPVLSALGRWVFRPAELDGQPVPAKLLLGIPLSLND